MTSQLSTVAASSAVDHEAIDGLKAGLRGELLLPDDAGYDQARQVWNAMIDRRPVLIARCHGVADVMASVNFAREHGLLVSVRGGGHNVSGKAVCDDGLMIDLSPMKSIRVDPAAMTVRAEPGVLLGELDHETQAFGLATPSGTVPTTGIAGLTLGGGAGWLTGKHGLAIDNLLSADIVTADGRLLTASANENEDLFWGLRGAGANLGIVTSFEYRLHPVNTVLGGMVIHPFERAREVLRFFREFTAEQPDELITNAAVITLPDGTPAVAMLVCYAGELEEGERVVAPLRCFGQPIADMIQPMPFVAQQAILGVGFPPGRLNYWKSGLTNQISDAAIETIVDYGSRMPSPFSAIVFAHSHGAFSRVGKTETAYFPRDLQYNLIIMASWTDGGESDRNIEWTREFFQAVQPHFSSGVYVNDLGHDEGAQRVREAYGGNYDRLVEIKTKYDPTNFFRLNPNIQPL